MRWLLPLLLVLAPACGNGPEPATAGTEVAPPAPTVDEPEVADAPDAVEPETPEEPETPPVADPPEPAVPEAAPTPDAPPLEPPSVTGEPTPGLLYERCRDRVEQPEADGECTNDADCASSGCGSEVCTTAAAATDLMTTCEIRQCFSVLDSCGCVKGRCTWSLKTEVPPMKNLKKLDLQ
jgi:eight-cysteine-cluster-containing protein